MPYTGGGKGGPETCTGEDIQDNQEASCLVQSSPLSECPLNGHLNKDTTPTTNYWIENPVNLNGTRGLAKRPSRRDLIHLNSTDTPILLYGVTSYE